MWSQGVTVEDFVVEEGNREKLKNFLAAGGVKLEGWNENSFVQLERELLNGEASLHTDVERNAVRVVSVAKPVIFDAGDHTVLIEAFQTFGAAGTDKQIKVKCSGMSEKFNPLEESCQAACARAMEEELKFCVDGAEFCANSQLVRTLAPSQKFVGLKSEYHLWYCMLSQQAVLSLQAKIPKMKMTGVDETNHSTNPKTLWWAWCPSLSVREVERHLSRLTESTPFAGVDFAAELKLGTPGEQVREEAMMGKRWTAAAPQWQRDLLFKPKGTVSSVPTKCAEDATLQSRRLPECRRPMVEFAPEVNGAGSGHCHHSGGSRLRTHPLARSSRHAAVWSLRILDDDRDALPTARTQVLQSMGDESSSPEARRHHGRRNRLQPRPSRAHVLCCATGR